MDDKARFRVRVTESWGSDASNADPNGGTNIYLYLIALICFFLLVLRLVAVR